jgi:hypothetical protein
MPRASRFFSPRYVIIFLVLLFEGGGFALRANAKPVRITIPAYAAKVSGLVHIRVAHSHAVTRLSVYVDGLSLATVSLNPLNQNATQLMVDGSHALSASRYRHRVGKLSLIWDSTTANNGTHTISAVGYGSNGQYLDRSSARVQVSNKRKRTPTPTATPAPTMTATPASTMTATPAPSQTATPSATPTPRVLTTTLTLTSANNGQTFKNYRISTTSGDCVDMKGVTGVTFEDSDIGPCAGRGIYINSGSSNNIYDSYIHVDGASTGCCDTRDGVFLNGSSYNTIQGNVIAFSESNVEDFGNDNTITGNFMLNPQGIFPRGQQIQTGNSATNTVISNNLLVSTSDSTLGPALGTDSTAPVPYSQGTTSSPPEDSINIYQSSNTLVDNNYVTGGLDAITPGSGGCQSPSGCGILGADYQTNSSTITGNIVVDTGQCGIGMGNGTDHVVTNNKVINLNPNSGGNTAIYIWNQYAPACGPVLLNGNVATEIQSSGYASGFWNGGGCAPVTCDGTNTAVSGCNTFDSGNARTAYDALIADPAVITPPLIPPLPKNCVANSPFSTQTSLPPCS